MKPRHGDQRPLHREVGASLALCPSRPFRWLPRHGKPFCIGEWFTQHAVKTLARVPIYFGIVGLLTACVLVFGLPFVGGG